MESCSGRASNNENSPNRAETAGSSEEVHRQGMSDEQSCCRLSATRRMWVHGAVVRLMTIVAAGFCGREDAAGAGKEAEDDCWCPN